MEVQASINVNNSNVNTQIKKETEIDSTFNNIFSKEVNKFSNRNSDIETNKGDSAKVEANPKKELKKISDKIDKEALDELKERRKAKTAPETIDAGVYIFEATLSVLAEDDIDLSEVCGIGEDGKMQILPEGIEKIVDKVEELIGEFDLTSLEKSNLGDIEEMVKLSLNFITEEYNATLSNEEIDVQTLGVDTINQKETFIISNEDGLENDDTFIRDEIDINVDENQEENVKIHNEDKSDAEIVEMKDMSKIEDSVNGNDAEFSKFKEKIVELINEVQINNRDTNIIEENVNKFEGNVVTFENLDVSLDDVSDLEEVDIEEIKSENLEVDDAIENNDKRDIRNDNKVAKVIDIENEQSESEIIEDISNVDTPKADEKNNELGNEEHEKVLETFKGSKEISSDTFIVDTKMNDNMQIFEAKINTENETANVQSRFAEVMKVMDQTVEGISLQVSEIGSEMQIRLDPENLGKLDVKIATENGLVVAKIQAESEKVKEIIESNLQFLKESLENKGLNIQSLDVSVGQNSSSSSGKEGLEYQRELLLQKNPHKNLGNTLNKMRQLVENNNRTQNINRSLHMMESRINYIA